MKEQGYLLLYFFSMNKDDLTLTGALQSADNLHLEFDLMQESELTKGQKTRVCTKKLLKTVEKCVFTANNKQLDIKAFYVTASGEDVYSLVMRYKQKADIIINEARTLCWRRFCKAKELCHLFTDCQETFSANSHDVIEAVLQGRSVNIHRPDEVLNPESFAFYMALEIMVPPSVRTEIKDMESSNKGSFQIAQRLKVPETLLLAYFLEGSEYGAVSDSLRNY